jgi:hypothetical protein
VEEKGGHSLWFEGRCRSRVRGRTLWNRRSGPLRNERHGVERKKVRSGWGWVRPLSQVRRREPIGIERRHNEVSTRWVKEGFLGGMKQVFKAGIAFFNGVEGRHRRKGIVEDDVILRRHPLSSRVEDQRNQGRMFIRETNKDALPCATIPLRDLLTVLEGRIQNVNWTPKDMRTGDIGMYRLDPAP